MTYFWSWIQKKICDIWNYEILCNRCLRHEYIIKYTGIQNIRIYEQQSTIECFWTCLLVAVVAERHYREQEPWRSTWPVTVHPQDPLHLVPDQQLDFEVDRLVLDSVQRLDLHLNWSNHKLKFKNVLNYTTIVWYTV